MAGLAALVLVALLAPGLEEVRHLLAHADGVPLVAGVAFEALSCAAYVVMVPPVFSRRMSWRMATELGLVELAAGSIVPASGAGGVAVGAWVLGREGMDSDRIARRSVAFLIVKSSVNFAAVIVIGGLMAIGLLGPSVSPLLTLLPAGLALAVTLGVVGLPRLGPGEPAPPRAGRVGHAVAASRRALIEGTSVAGELVREHDPLVVIGAFGYWIFDNAVLWATFHALGGSPPLTVVLMGYLVGQLGGALPIPGGLGGIDFGLFGMFVAFGTDAALAAGAILAYRLILFWIPLVLGAGGLVSLRRTLARTPAPG